MHGCSDGPCAFFEYLVFLGWVRSVTFLMADVSDDKILNQLALGTCSPGYVQPDDKNQDEDDVFYKKRQFWASGGLGVALASLSCRVAITLGSAWKFV